MSGNTQQVRPLARHRTHAVSGFFVLWITRAGGNCASQLCFRVADSIAERGSNWPRHRPAVSGLFRVAM